MKRLPRAVWSQLGPVPVTLAAGLAERQPEPALGEWDFRRRAISIEPDADVAGRLQTLLHECGHLALTDAGLHNLIGNEMAEAIVDAVGSWLAGSVLAGWITLRVPKDG